MSFPAVQPATANATNSALFNAAAAAGITSPTGGLSQLDMVTAVAANLLTDLPSSPATNISAIQSGTVQGTSGGALTVLGEAAAAAASLVKKQKIMTAIVDATFTPTFTVTVPNAKHSAILRVTYFGQLGAGGAIGAGEAAGAISYDYSIVRTAGVAVVAVQSTAYASTVTLVAGAGTIAILGQVSAISGAVGVANTFTVDIKITKGSGSSDNHTAVVVAELLNANTTGITFA